MRAVLAAEDAVWTDYLGVGRRIEPRSVWSGRCGRAGRLSQRGAHLGYGLGMRILYIGTSGSSDPTRASLPLHLAVNGSVEAGQSVGIMLAGDATELLKADIRERLEGLGVPPVRDLLAKARQHEVPVYV